MLKSIIRFVYLSILYLIIYISTNLVSSDKLKKLEVFACNKLSHPMRLLLFYRGSGNFRSAPVQHLRCYLTYFHTHIDCVNFLPGLE